MTRFLILLFPMILMAESFLVSSIPLPKTYVQDLDPYDCDDECLRDLIDDGQIFSFLAHAKKRSQDPELNDIRLIFASVLNLGSAHQGGEIKIAMLLPHKRIGRYAYSTTNAAFAYLLTKNQPFEIKSFEIEDESSEEISRALEEIETEGFYYVIAPVTKEGANTIAGLDTEVTIYIPTINKRDVDTSSGSLFFGGIDYRAQIDTLLTEAVSPLVIFYDKSQLGKELGSYTEETFLNPDIGDMNNTELSGVSAFFSDLDEDTDLNTTLERKSYSYALKRDVSNLEHQIKENEKIQDGSFILNTPIVKSGMVMSQLTLYDTNVTNILSTQINYDPLLFSMTQYRDRKGMVIANSIGENNNILIEANNLLGNDIVYDWINYATTVGTDLLFQMITQDEREYELPLVDNQVEYPIMLSEPSYSRFIEHIPLSASDIYAADEAFTP